MQFRLTSQWVNLDMQDCVLCKGAVRGRDSGTSLIEGPAQLRLNLFIGSASQELSGIELPFRACVMCELGFELLLKSKSMLNFASWLAPMYVQSALEDTMRPSLDRRREW